MFPINFFNQKQNWNASEIYGIEEKKDKLGECKKRDKLEELLNKH